MNAPAFGAETALRTYQLRKNKGSLPLAVLRILMSGNRYQMLFAKHLSLNTLDDIESKIL
jgi:hypothetical protein